MSTGKTGIVETFLTFESPIILLRIVFRDELFSFPGRICQGFEVCLPSVWGAGSVLPPIVLSSNRRWPHQRRISLRLAELDVLCFLRR